MQAGESGWGWGLRIGAQPSRGRRQHWRHGICPSRGAVCSSGSMQGGQGLRPARFPSPGISAGSGAGAGNGCGPSPAIRSSTASSEHHASALPEHSTSHPAQLSTMRCPVTSPLTAVLNHGSPAPREQHNGDGTLVLPRRPRAQLQQLLEAVYSRVGQGACTRWQQPGCGLKLCCQCWVAVYQRWVGLQGRAVERGL